MTGNSDIELINGIAGRRCITKHGLCNRINGLMTCLEAWPEGFRLHWPVNGHCPVPYHDLFHPMENVEVDDFFDMRPDNVFEENTYRHSRYFTQGDREKSIATAWKVVNLMKVEIPEGFPQDPGNWWALHHRILHYDKVRQSFHHVIRMINRLVGPNANIFLMVDADGEEFRKTLVKQGHVVFPRFARMTVDADRSHQSVLDFAADWKFACHCKGGFATLIRSTVLNTLQAITDNVWSPAKNGLNKLEKSKWRVSQFRQSPQP